MTLIEQAHDILNRALEDHNPTHVFLLTSGGNDSVVPLHLFRDHPRVTAAVHIDTGIRVPDVEPHVRRTCEAFSVPLLVYRAEENTRADGTPDPQRYGDIVTKHGFPGPAQHSIMYARLKQRQVERLVRDHKSRRGDRVALVTGVRKAESARRMGYVREVTRVGAQVWVAPVLNWRDADMALYREHYALPRNPVADALGMSGECLCGAFAKPGELARLEAHYPEVAERIKCIERDSGCLWGWEEGPPAQWIEARRGQEAFDFHPLCSSCIAKGRAS